MSKNLVGIYSDFIFSFQIDNIVFCASIIYLSYTGCSIRIIEPWQFKGMNVSFPHIFYLGIPTLRGYLYEGDLSFDFYLRLRMFIGQWYHKYQIVQERKIEINEYKDAGILDSDIESWLSQDTLQKFYSGELSKLLFAIME